VTANRSDAHPDARRHAFRPDLADAALRGRVLADRFVDAVQHWSRVPVTALRREPDHRAARDTEVLFGEQLRVFEVVHGWAWVQIASDGYVGYVPVEVVDANPRAPTHRVRSRSMLVYSARSALAEPLMQLPMNASVCVTRFDGDFAELAGGGFVSARQLVSVPCDASSHVACPGDRAADYVVLAESFLGVPYLYGGRSALGGIDCSGLVQMALAAIGIQAPRDSDMQSNEVGGLIGDACETFDEFQRGDLVFWPGHVAIMTSPDTVVHASATNMCVTLEPLDAVAARSRKDGPRFGRVRRL